MLLFQLAHTRSEGNADQNSIWIEKAANGLPPRFLFVLN